MEAEKGKRLIVRGDFNARTGELGGRGRWGEGDGEEEGRRSKDKEVNGEGKS